MTERLKCFLKHWAKSKNDPITLETVQGYISLLLMSQEETDLIDQEIREMLSRNAISNRQGKRNSVCAMGISLILPSTTYIKSQSIN